MKQIVFISEECHGTIGAASNFYKAKQFLLESGWLNEMTFFYDEDVDEDRPISEIYGDDWQEVILEADKGFFDGLFYFSEKDFLE